MFKQILSLAPSSAHMLIGCILLGLSVNTAQAQEFNERTSSQTAILSHEINIGARDSDAQQQAASYSLFSGAQIDGRGLGRLSEITSSIGGLSVRDDGPTQASFALRGLGIDTAPDNQAASTGLDGSVGIFYDGASFSHPYFANIPLVDVDYVSVARGGQSVLYGRDASGGAVNVVSNLAQTDATFYDIQGGIGGEGDNQNELDFVGNIAFNDDYALRITYRHRLRDGSFIANGREVNDIDDQFLRVSAAINPLDDLDIALLLEAYHDNSYWGARADANSNQSARNHIDLVSYRGLVSLEYRFLDDYKLNVRGSYHHMSNLRTPGTIDTRREFSADMWFDRLDLDARISGEISFLAWTTGLSYLRDQRRNFTNTQYDDRQAVADEADTAFTANYQSIAGFTLESLSYFVDLDFEVTDILAISTGARFVEDKRTGVVQTGFTTAERFSRDDDAETDDEFTSSGIPSAPENFFATNIGAQFFRDQKNAATNYYASLDVVTNDDAIFYARYDQSVKMGGINENLNAAGELIHVGDQINKTWEVGYKAEWLGQRIRFNTAIYQSRIENIQASQRETITTTDDQDMSTTSLGNEYFIGNVGNAEILGLEIDSAIQLQDDLQLQFVYNYLLDNDYDNVSLINGTLPLAPNEYFLVGIQWRGLLPIGTLEVGTTWARTGHQTLTASDTAQNIPAHSEVSARVELRLLDEKLRVALIGKNVSDSRHATTARISTLSENQRTPTITFPTNPQNRGIINYGDQYLIEVGYRF